MDNENFLTINEYAQTKGVSTQAVYKQLKAHEWELSDKIINREGKRWLSPEAIEILDKASKTSAPIIIDSIDKSKLEDAQRRIQELEEQLQIAQNKVLTAQETIIGLQRDKIDYIAIGERSKLLLEQKDLEMQNLKTRSLIKRIFNKN